MNKRVLITGITGQDGFYFAELLLEKGYSVYGLVCRSSTSNLSRIAGLLDKVTLLPGDLSDAGSLVRVLEVSDPDEVYNLASQSFVAESFEEPVHTADVTGLGVVRMLEAVRMVKPQCRFYQASNSEMFGNTRQVPQNEKAPYCPRSSYGYAKLFGHWATLNYRAG